MVLEDGHVHDALHQWALEAQAVLWLQAIKAGTDSQ
jgi:hypothetical protein